MTDLKDEIEEILHPEKKDLHPPIAPPKEIIVEHEWDDQFYESVAGETEVGRNVLGSCASESVHTLPVATNSKPAIDFKAIANSSEFQRFIYYLFTGKTHRGSLERLKKDIIEFKEDTNLVRDYKGVMNEFKEKVARLRK